jgi:uncharacterized protein YjbI with pentapeptide repeats
MVPALLQTRILSKFCQLSPSRHRLCAETETVVKKLRTMSAESNFSQKEVLLLVQKSLHDKKVIFLPTANWSGLDLRGTILKNANLKFASLSGCNLQSADLENANVHLNNAFL